MCFWIYLNTTTKKLYNSVGFGTRFVTVNDQQIKLQIWDTVREKIAHS